MDTPDDLQRLRNALRYLPALKEELEGVKVSSTRRKQDIIDELYTLEGIITSAMAPVRTSYYYLTCT